MVFPRKNNVANDISPHKEEHLGSSVFITDIVIGMSDGLTVPFALAAGLSGAVQSNAVVITAGIAEIVAGSIAMALGGYLVYFCLFTFVFCLFQPLPRISYL
jgi:hypothetical protein